MALDLVQTIQPFVEEKMNCKIQSFPLMAPTDDAQKMSRLNASGFNDLESLKRKINNQMKPVVTSQEPSDA